jgi:hypothetical protein
VKSAIKEAFRAPLLSLLRNYRRNIRENSTRFKGEGEGAIKIHGARQLESAGISNEQINLAYGKSNW